MKIKLFLSAVISNILQIEYFLLPSIFDSNHRSPQHSSTNDEKALLSQQPQQPDNHNAITMDWMIDHIGTRGNYPNYKFNNDSYLRDNITSEYTIQQMQLIIRHGTRYPVLSGMDAINQTLQKLKNASNNDHLIGWIKSYKNKYLYRRTGQLDHNGQKEAYLIGKRLATRHPDFVSGLVDDDIITQEFQASASWSSRTSQTAQALSIGLFEGQGILGPAKLLSVPVFTLTKNNDSLIAMHNACPKWQRYAKKATSVILEPVLERYLRPIASRLSMDLGIDVTTQDVMDIHEACTTEVAMHQTVDTFCRLLTRQDVLQLEYLDDLKHYYKYAHGLPDLNDEMACDLGKNIIDNIEKKLQQQEETVKLLDIKVGHSETVLPLRNLLGLYRDETGLLTNSTQEEIDKRAYKLSNFGYLANNIAFQLLSHKKNQTLFVRLLENEAPIVAPGCQDVLCPIDQFLEYMKSPTQCDFKEFCKV